MEIIRCGKARTVFLIPFLGIVIKVANIHLWLAFHELKRHMIKAKGKRLRILKMHLFLPISYQGFIKGMLFGGIAENWMEFYFYQTTRDPFLQPTYFSLFGLVNIQKLGSVHDTNEMKFWSALADIVGRDISLDPHHFENPRNFCFERGKLTICDYGSSKTRSIVQKYGQDIHKKYSPPS